MTDIREILRRLQLGEPSRPIARDLGVSRNTVAHYRAWAAQQGVPAGGTLPDAATLATLLTPVPTERPAHEQSRVEPWRERVLALHEQGVDPSARKARPGGCGHRAGLVERARVRLRGGRHAPPFTKPFKVTTPPGPCRRRFVRRYVGPTRPKWPAFGCQWVDTSVTPSVIRKFSPRAHRWEHVHEVEAPEGHHLDFVASFQTPTSLRLSYPVNVNPPVERMLAGKMGRAGRNGRPAFMACPVLASLLNVSVEQVVDLLANYRQTLKPKNGHRIHR